MSAPTAIAPRTAPNFTPEFEAEIKARLAPPAPPEPAVAPAEPVMTAPEIVVPEPVPLPAALLLAIEDAGRAASILATPLRLARVPSVLRPAARLAARVMRLALLPYLSRQQDFNHKVVVALQLLAQPPDRSGPR